MAKVLLLHTDQAETETFCAWMARWGLECDAVTTADAAFAAIEAPAGPGIVVIDFSAMRSQAPEISARLGRLQAERPLQVLIVTDEPVEEARKAFPAIAGSVQPDDVLSKPLDARQFRGKLRAAERLLAMQIELSQAAQALRFFASHDSLTSLTQRQAAVEMLKQETQRSLRTHAPISLLLLDVDLFHALNGTSGYDAGDAILREIGLRLRRSMRGYDYASRYGNDEFLVLLPECNLHDAARQALRLQNEVFGPKFVIGGAEFDLSACIAVTESFGRHPHAVLAELEITLRKAKLAGTCSVECAHEPATSAELDPAIIGRGRAPQKAAWADEVESATPLTTAVQ